LVDTECFDYGIHFALHLHARKNLSNFHNLSRNNMSESPAPLVLVTGISGFIASWVAHGALKLGYRVRGTVRSLGNEEKVKHLRDLCPGSKYKIELVEADLMKEDGWAAAVQDCDYILHVASPFPLQEPKDPNDLILPAINGTLNVLKAASKLTKLPKRVVVTSSAASIAYGQDPTNKVFTDADWTVPDSKEFPIPTYNKSKVLAERAAWKFVEDLPADRRFELATINPTLVQGPMLSGSQCSSADIIKQVRKQAQLFM
jgi:nucleoside-diphosphate-sugar epimerase